jgi:MFS family permease
MIFVQSVTKAMTMQRTPTVLLVLIIIITFPFWIALAAVVFGLVVGIFGGIIGLIGGIFGGIVGLIGGIFGGIFGFDSWHWGWSLPHFHFNKYVFFALLIIAALVINKRQNR